MNPYLIVGALVLLGSAYAYGRHDGKQIEIAAQAKAEKFAQEAADAATGAAVRAIGKIKIQQTTIRQELEREIRMLPSDGKCDLPVGVFDTLNQAITGEVRDRAGVPGTDAAAGPAVRDAAP